MKIEKKVNGSFPEFNFKMTDKKVAVMFDKNTKPYAEKLKLSLHNLKFTDIFFDDAELIPDDKACDYACSLVKSCDYLLAVGSGSLNDMAKWVSTRLGIECGVMPTAASMDGYVSKGAAIMENGVKVTEEVHAPSDILIDIDVIATAPEIMTASGFGDIIGKYTCLADWKLSNIINDEEINDEAYSLMLKARKDCVVLFEELTSYKKEAISKLIEALITAGVAMAICGNSRPASGSEHHMSHFLEMDFAKRGERIPMHGVKVAIGTMVSIELYNYLKKVEKDIPHKKEIIKLADELPSVEQIETMLLKIGCPTKFSQIGVRKETMSEMLDNAYAVRNRYTILTLFNQYDLMKDVKDYLIKKYY